LQWHLKFWKPRCGFALYWNKTIWDKRVFLHVATATDGCNVAGRHNFLAQKLEEKFVCLVSVHSPAHRFASDSHYTAADLSNMVYETAKALQCNYGSVLLFQRFNRFAWQCIRLQWRQKVGKCSAQANGCRVRQQWKLGVRFWFLGRTEAADRKQNDAMQCALFYWNFNMMLSFCQSWHLTWQNWAKFFRRDLLTLHR